MSRYQALAVLVLICHLIASTVYYVIQSVDIVVATHSSNDFDIPNHTWYTAVTGVPAVARDSCM